MWCCDVVLLIDDLADVALRALTRATLLSLREDLERLVMKQGLPILHQLVVKEYLNDLLSTKAWKLSSILTRARYVHMLAVREGCWSEKPI
jgi:hypothetical protein